MSVSIDLTLAVACPGWFCAGGRRAASRAAEANVQATLQRWLQDLVLIQAVSVDVVDSAAYITIQYVGPAHPADAGGAVFHRTQQRFVFGICVRGRCVTSQDANQDTRDEHCDDARHAGHDYPAVTFASFRRQMLDSAGDDFTRYSERAPSRHGHRWSKCCRAADELSMFQDAVATEAYLATARLRDQCGGARCSIIG